MVQQVKLITRPQGELFVVLVTMLMMMINFISDTKGPYKTCIQKNRQQQQHKDMQYQTAFTQLIKIYKHCLQCFQKQEENLVSLCVISVKAMINAFFDSTSLHINLYIKFLNTA